MKSNYYYNNHANHKLAKENLAILITNVDEKFTGMLIWNNMAHIIILHM